MMGGVCVCEGVKEIKHENLLKALCISIDLGEYTFSHILRRIKGLIHLI
jgi:hypothetical protein